MMVRLALLLFAIVATSAAAFQPRTGHWNNPNEAGSGMNIDLQDGTFVVTIYSYATDGSAQWYIASGKGTNDNHNFAGSLDKARAGQCISCTDYIFPSSDGSDGAISISFASEVSATVNLPGGRVTQIQPFNFGFGDPPNGLLGEWVFVYDIISTFADRFNFTTIGSGTVNGNGLATDLDRLAGCEYQVSGPLVGMVLCADVDSAGNIQNGYVFKFGLDETYSGNWLSPITGNLYSMKGFKVKSPTGSTRAAMVEDASAAAKIAESATSVDTGRAFTEMSQTLPGSSATPEALRTSLAALAAALRSSRPSQ